MAKKHFSDWRSVRMWERDVAHGLRVRHALWLHGLCIGCMTLGMTWAMSALLMWAGVDSLALRYLVSLGAGYAVYLLVLWGWASSLLNPSRSSSLDGIDPGMPDIFAHRPGAPTPSLHSGGGGDFGGGGASGGFEPVSMVSDSGLSDVASGALEGVANAEEGAVVLVPVVAVFVVGVAVLAGAGSLLLVYFGSEALLAVTVELAFAYTTSRVAVRVTREGWLLAAVRLTYKPLFGALLCAVLLGAAIDYWIPTAQSLPQALKALRSAR